MKQVKRAGFCIMSVAFLIFAVACGGGSSSVSPPIIKPDPPVQQLYYVPDVFGKTEFEAISLITSASLTSGEISYEYHDNMPFGNVIDQDPPKLTSVAKASAVNLTLSRGPEDTTDPGNPSNPGNPKYPGNPPDPSTPDPFADEMVIAENGTFLMGCTQEQEDDCLSYPSYEEPEHQVELSDFYIGKYPVTQKQWYEIMGTHLGFQCFIIEEESCDSMETNGYGDDYPMYYVTWDDVQEFIKRLNALTGKKYRLPTEAEWEYAARGGNSEGYKYSGSNDVNEVAWYDVNSGGSAHPVNAASKKANELGLYGMSGNVWEWVSDWYGRYYYSSSPSKDPDGPASGECGEVVEVNGKIYEVFSPGECHVLRGGSWANDYLSARVSSRYYSPHGDSAIRYSDIGFRLARDAD